MTLTRTRVIISAAIFAANCALSLSNGAAEAQAPRHIERQMERFHHRDEFAAVRAKAVAAKPEMTKGPASDYSGFCGFSGADAC